MCLKRTRAVSLVNALISYSPGGDTIMEAAETSTSTKADGDGMGVYYVLNALYFLELGLPQNMLLL